MMSRSAYISIILFLCIIVSFSVEAQRGSKYKRQRAKSKTVTNYRGGVMGANFRPYYYLSFNVNALNYFGDLAPVNRAASTDISFTRPGFGGNFGYRFSPRSDFRIGFNYGRIKGDDFSSDPNDENSVNRYLRNLSFRNDVKEVNMGFSFYLFPNHGSANIRPNINAYLFVGASVFHHEPKGLVPDMDHTTGGTSGAPQAGEWVKLRPLGTEGQFLDIPVVEPYKPIQFSVPLAIGVKFRLPAHFDAGVEFGYRLLFTDYIDDVSSRYVGHERFDSDLARIMADRSAEPVAAWTGIERIGVEPTGAVRDGTTYYSLIELGAGLDDGAIRGNPDDNDMIFMTTIRLTYVLGRHRKTPKFR